MDKKEYWIKITMEDYQTILLAYSIAACELAIQYPQPKRGRESELNKEKRKQNLKICERLNQSQERFLKTSRETMKEVS